jgi:hypothetical protein
VSAGIGGSLVRDQRGMNRCLIRKPSWRASCRVPLTEDSNRRPLTIER